MQIILDQSEIVAAIRSHVAKHINLASGSDMQIDLKSSRSDAGITATLDINTPLSALASATNTRTTSPVEPDAAEPVEAAPEKEAPKKKAAKRTFAKAAPKEELKDEPEAQQAEAAEAATEAANTASEETTEEVVEEKPAAKAGGIFTFNKAG